MRYASYILLDLGLYDHQTDMCVCLKQLRNLLEQYHELYLRWTSHAPHEAIGPFSSRAPAGLYIQVAPRGEDDNGYVAIWDCLLPLD